MKLFRKNTSLLVWGGLLVVLVFLYMIMRNKEGFMYWDDYDKNCKSSKPTDPNYADCCRFIIGIEHTAPQAIEFDDSGVLRRNLDNCMRS